MKVSKIDYISAVYFFVLALVIYLITGILQLIVEAVNPGTFASLGLGTPTFLTSIITGPITGGILGGVFALFAILIYNLVAKKYPFSIVLKK